MHKGDKAKSEVDEINSMLKAISHNGGARTEILRERRRSKEQSDKESLATKATESLATQDTAHKFDKHHLHHIDVSIPHHGADALTGAASRGVRAAALQRLSRAAAKVRRLLCIGLKSRLHCLKGHQDAVGSHRKTG